MVILDLLDNDMEREKNFREIIQMTDPSLILREQLLQRADGHRQPPFLIEILALPQRCRNKESLELEMVSHPNTFP